jgi:hypothetical protein
MPEPRWLEGRSTLMEIIVDDADSIRRRSEAPEVLEFLEFIYDGGFTGDRDGVCA